MNLIIHTDGGSRGNPGISGGGVFIEQVENDNASGKTQENTKQTILEQAIFFGQKTNNEAEYLAFLAALDWLIKHTESNSISSATFYLDSKLVVEQINKNWKIKEPRLQEMARTAWEKLKALPYPFVVKHILRAENAQADFLANQAMDQQHN